MGALPSSSSSLLFFLCFLRCTRVERRCKTSPVSLARSDALGVLPSGRTGTQPRLFRLVQSGSVPSSDAFLVMHRNLLPRRYPVLTHISKNDRKNAIERLLTHEENMRQQQQQQQQQPGAMTRRSEFVHATVEDDLIGPGHVRSRSRSRTRDATRGGQRSTSSKPFSNSSSSSGSALMMRPGLEIHLPQRGRYIVVEDVRTSASKKTTRSSTPEFVLVNKENGRAIPLHSLYQNPQRGVESVRFTTPADPPVDYDHHPPRQHWRHVGSRSLSDLSDEGHCRTTTSSSASYSPSLAGKNSVNNYSAPWFFLLTRKRMSSAR